MKTMPIIPVAAVVAIPLLAAGPARALTGKAAPSTPTATAASPQRVDLGPIVVTGIRLHTLPLPVKLQMLKAALNRPVNLRHENLSKLVCRFNRDPREVIRQPLHCETNCDILRAQNAFKGFATNCDIGESAALNERLAAYINSHRMNRSQLMSLFKRLPPPGSSYTFQVKSHGKVVARWVVEDGQVTEVEVRKKDKH